MRASTACRQKATRPVLQSSQSVWRRTQSFAEGLAVAGAEDAEGSSPRAPLSAEPAPSAAPFSVDPASSAAPLTAEPASSAAPLKAEPASSAADSTPSCSHRGWWVEVGGWVAWRRKRVWRVSCRRLKH